MANDTYCVKADVQRALAPSADTSGTAYAATDDEYTDAIKEAMGVVDLYVASRYVINIETAVDPDADPVVLVAVNTIRFLTRDVAAYLLTLTYKRNQDVVEDDPVRLRYNMALSRLKDIASGVLDLDLPVNEDSTASDVGVYNQYEGKLFTADDFDLTSVPKSSRIGYTQRVYNG